MPRRFVIDTDTASDDAVALVMALREPTVDVEAITVVAGNVPLEQAVQNALYTIEVCGAAVPVYRGQSAPLHRPLQTAQEVHGHDGMGDIGLDLRGRAPDPGDAVDVMLDVFTRAPGEVSLLTLGPLTNVAAALLREPGLAAAVADCFVMGGAGSGTGNVTRHAEYNFWADPEAARIVVESGLALTQVGWDISVASASFAPDEAAALRALGPLGAFSVDIQAVLDRFAREQSGLPGFDLPDPLATAVAIDPSIATTKRCRVDVVAGDGPERGRDLIDWEGVTGAVPNVDVVVEVPRERFVAMLERLLRD